MTVAQIYPSSILVETTLRFSLTIRAKHGKKVVKITIFIRNSSERGMSLGADEPVLLIAVDEVIYLFYLSFLGGIVFNSGSPIFFLLARES